MLDEQDVSAEASRGRPPAYRQNAPAVNPPSSADSASASAAPPTRSSAEMANTRSSVCDDARVSSEPSGCRQRQRDAKGLGRSVTVAAGAPARSQASIESARKDRQ